MIVILLFILILIIYFSIVAYKKSIDKKIFLESTACLFILSSMFGVLVYTYICKDVPSAIDVYRGKTKLEITETIRDSTLVSRDSIVVFK